MNLDRDVEDDFIAKAKALRFKAKAFARRKTRKRRQQRGTPSATWYSMEKDVYPEVPLQQNSFDCGVFMLKYAAWFFNAYIQECAIPINRKSVAQNLKGFVDKNMFRYSDK